MRSEQPQGGAPQADAATAAIAAELGHHTALLERLVDPGRPEYLEDVQTFAMASGAASAYVFDPAIPQTAEVEIEAWESGGAGVPLFVLDGNYTETQAANMIGAGASGYVPALFVIPANGVARVRRPSYSGELTICSLGAPTALALVTVKVRACE